MNWEEVGAIGQVLGSIAVFVTLGYLAAQVRHTRQETRRALSQGRSEGHRELLAQARDERIFSVQLKADAALGAPPNPVATALMEKAGLSLEEANLMMGMQIAWWTYRLQMIPDVEELPPMQRIAFDNQIRGSYGRPGVARVFYETYLKGAAHPDALHYVDNLLAQPG
jgi:hypothetical protein